MDPCPRCQHHPCRCSTQDATRPGDGPPPSAPSLRIPNHGGSTIIPLPEKIQAGPPPSSFHWIDPVTGLVYNYTRSGLRLLHNASPSIKLKQGFVLPGFDGAETANFLRAVRGNNLDQVEKLIPFLYKININFTDQDMKTPLDYALQNKNLCMCDLLCSAGGIIVNDPGDWKTFTKQYPLLQTKYDCVRSLQFSRFASIEDVGNMKILWESSPPNSICPNLFYKNYTPLDWSIEFSNQEMAEFLCSIGARTLVNPTDYVRSLFDYDLIVKHPPVCTWNKFQVYDWVKDIPTLRYANAVQQAELLLKAGVNGTILLSFSSTDLAQYFAVGPRIAIEQAIAELKKYDGS